MPPSSRGPAVAALVHGLDGLFLPPSVDAYALAREGTPEERWAREVFGDRCLPYRPHGAWDSPEALLVGSDIAARLTRAGVTNLLLTSGCTPIMRAWAQGHCLRLWMSPFTQQLELEDKLWFHGWCARLGLPTPEGGPCTLGAGLLVPLPAVVQVPRSMGGEGTFFVRTPEDLERIRGARALRAGGTVLARRLVEGAPCGITVLVTPDAVRLSAVRRQCYLAAPSLKNLLFAGVQWLPSASLSAGARARINEVLLRLGAALHVRRFVGAANVDFMLAGDEVLLLECNPRLSAATPQLLRHPELLEGGAAEALVRCYASPPPRAERPAQHGLPETTFDGAAMDLITPPGFRRATVSRAPANGRYSPDGATRLGAALRPDGEPDLCLVALAQPGEVVGAEETLATVLSTEPLFDEAGARLPVAEALADRLSFKYSK